MFQLKMDTGNAAFHDASGDWPEKFAVSSEVRRILYQVIEDIADFKTEGKCIDVNGNVVGSWTLE